MLSVYAVCTTLIILVLVLVLVYLYFRMRTLATTSKLATPSHRKADLSNDELEMQQNTAYATISSQNPQQHNDYECLQ